MNLDYQRELLAFDEKIALAELEESRARERVQELKYQKARFCLEAYIVSLKDKQNQIIQQISADTPVDVSKVNA